MHEIARQLSAVCMGTAGDTSGSLIAGLATNYLTATNSYLGLTDLDFNRSIIIADLRVSTRDDLAQETTLFVIINYNGCIVLNYKS